MRTVAALVILACAGPLAAAAKDDAAAALTAALAGSDDTAKRAAVQAVAALDNADALPLLVTALADRQARSAALSALESKTGLTPRNRPDSDGTVGPGWPGHPKTSDGAGWSAWLAEWQKKQAEDARLKKIEEDQKKAEADKKKKEAEEAKKKAGGEAADAKPGEGVEEPAAKPAADDSRYGRLDRIVLKDGGLLMAYIVQKREDLAGNLTSVEIVHRDGGGKEVLDAALIARIEEDIK